MTRNSTRGYELSQKFARRILPSGNERGVAMLLAIAFMIIMAGIGAVIVSTILGQVAPTALSQKETQTVYGAQAGMQAALSRFRAANLTNALGVQQVDSNGFPLGDPTKLPCSLSGTLDPTSPADGQGYTVTITYFDVDPTFQTTAWQTDVNNPDRLPCSTTPGVGVTSTVAHPLKFALLTSVGSGNALPHTTDSTIGNRSVTAVYQFKVSTVNIAGGLINDYDDGGAYCLSAVTASVGSTIQFLPAAQCTTANSALQLWVYSSGYELQLASTLANGAAGLCITGPVSDSDTTPENAVLQTCVASPSLARWNQLWDWYGSNTWAGIDTTISLVGNPPNAESGWNLGTGYPSGSNLTNKPLLVMNGGTYGGFSPSTSVGAGNAGYSTNEIVNYLEFGRCMDDTGESVTAAHMISYPCKQDPVGNGAGILWNQKFYYTEPAAQTAGPNDQYPAPPVAPLTTQTYQQILVQHPNGTTPPIIYTQYCLVPASAATIGTLVVLTTCPTSATSADWIRVYNTGTYASSYTFTTPGTVAGVATTLCLEVNPSITDGGWSELDLAACNGSLAQKWNAPPSYVAAELGGYKEIGG